MLAPDELDQIAMGISWLENALIEFAGEECCCASDGFDAESGQVAPKLALGIIVKQLKAFKDLVEELEGSGIDFGLSAFFAGMGYPESFEKFLIAQFLLG